MAEAVDRALATDATRWAPVAGDLERVQLATTRAIELTSLLLRN